MLPQRSHITRKRGVYYYRRRLPVQWGGEVAVSLRTKAFRYAEWLATRLDSAFEHVCQTMTSRPDIRKIITEHLQARLDFDMRSRVATPNMALYGVPYDPEDTPADCDRSWLLDALRDANWELTNRRYDLQKPLIDDLMEENSIPSGDREELAHALLRANVEFLEAVLRRTQGQFPSLIDPTVPLASDAPLPVTIVNEGPKLSSVLPDFFAFMVERKGWRAQTKAQSDATFRMFLEYCGDKPVQTYSRQDLSSFYDLLRGLPALYSKSAEWKGMSLSEIAEQSKGVVGERLAMKTVKRHFSALGNFFSHLKRHGQYLGENPAHGFDFPEKVRANQKRQMWEGEKLTQLFSSPVWLGCASEGRRSQKGGLILKDDRYWLPVLGLYHGNRLEEFAQLHRSDVRSDNGIWYFDINAEDSKQLKNEQSKRRVPIHPRIVRLGFLEYVEGLRADSNPLLFPELKPGGPDNKLGYYFTKWFSRYRQEIGVYQRGLDYHSFRHGVITKLYGASVPEPIIDELTGHEGGGVGRKVYNKKATPIEALHDAIARVDWPEVTINP